MKTKYFAIIFLIAVSAAGCFSQSRSNRLFRPCPGTINPAVVEIQRDGDIALTPCSGGDVLINGVVPTPASITFTGASRTNYFPYYSTQTNLAKSPFSWTGTVFTWNTAAEDGNFLMQFTPSLGAGSFKVGNEDFTATNYFNVDGTNGVIQIHSQNFVNLGDTLGAGNNTLLRVDDGNSAVNLRGDLGITLNSSLLTITPAIGDGIFFTVDDDNNVFQFGQNDVEAATINFGNSVGDGIRTFTFARTITAGGTTGNRTINLPAGTVNFAAAATAITVTNSVVTASSIILATARTNDATCSVKNVVPSAGSFVINMTAACTAETSVGFFVTN